ncbi:uncharacterized protein isoform X2 [Rhodnius prolixus]|uniref:uncharacterized protein isoform X2 n=1 Tax=Rhodnius prolixus TaxID=13249 RepID=UPI003D187AB6
MNKKKHQIKQRIKKRNNEKPPQSSTSSVAASSPDEVTIKTESESEGFMYDNVTEMVGNCTQFTKFLFNKLNPWQNSFKEIKTIMRPITDDGLIKKSTIQEGTGRIINCEDQVFVEVAAYIENRRSAIFHTSEPVLHFAGHESSFPGMCICLQAMHENELAQFYIHYKYAFGQFKVGSHVLPETDMMILIQTHDAFQYGNLVYVPEVEHHIPYDTTIKFVKKFSTLGLHCYKRAWYKSAQTNCRIAERILKYAVWQTDKERIDSQLHKKHLLIVRIAIVSQDSYFRPRRLLRFAKKFESQIPDILDNKSYNVCMSQAYSYFKDFKQAIQYAKRAHAFEPKNAVIDKWLTTLQKSMDDDYSSSEDSSLSVALHAISLSSCIDISEELLFLTIRADKDHISTNINQTTNINEALNAMAIAAPRPESSGGEEEDHESSCEGSEELIEQIEAQRRQRSLLIHRVNELISLLYYENINEITVTASFTIEERRAMLEEAASFSIIYREELDVIGRLRIVFIKPIHNARS